MSARVEVPREAAELELCVGGGAVRVRATGWMTVTSAGRGRGEEGVIRLGARTGVPDESTRLLLVVRDLASDGVEGWWDVLGMETEYGPEGGAWFETRGEMRVFGWSEAEKVWAKLERMLG